MEKKHHHYTEIDIRNLLIVLGEAIKQLGGKLRVDDRVLANEEMPNITITHDPVNCCTVYKKIDG